VGTNLGALDASRNLGLTQSDLAKNLTKLSSGLRINSAADDPAGLVISEQMRAQIGSLEQEIKNTDVSINMYQTGSQSIGQLQDDLVQLRSLAVAAANEGFNDEATSAAYQTAAMNLTNAYNHGIETAQFGSQELLDGSEGSVADIDQLTEIDLSTAEAAQASIEKIDEAINELGEEQGEIGSKITHDLESTRNSLSVSLQNMTAAESTIRDTDYAQEVALFVRNQLLQSSGTAMLMHANQSSQGVLGLLGG
jgi:flagellin